MTDNIKITPATEGALLDYALDDVGGVLHQLAKIEFGGDGEATRVTQATPLPVADADAKTALTDLKSALDALSARIAACDTGAVALDAATLAALENVTAVVSGSVSVSNLPSSDGLTNDQLRAEPLVVAFDPEDERQLLIDQSQPTMVGGRTRAGSAVVQVADESGAQILSDAPKQIQGQAWSSSGLASILCSADTQGYQSISLQIKGTWAGTITFYTSNDGADWLPLAGYSAGSGQTMSTTTTGVGLWSFPAVGRYFKAQITAYTSGTALCIGWLRSQPMPVLASTPSVNVAQLSGVAMAAQGAAVSGSPLPVSGWDGARTRRLMTDVVGNQSVVGGAPDTSANPLMTRSAPSTLAEDGIGEALGQILRELRYHSLVLQQMPLYLNLGASQVDEVQNFRDDPTLQSY